jgi:hypothetical protein
MEENVSYENNSANIKEPMGDDAVVYAHPGDVLRFGFDISQLRKEIVNGDLVIYTLSGKKITIANYAIMFAWQEQPDVVDIVGNVYQADDLMKDTRATLSTDELARVVVDRKVSSADTTLEGTQTLAHANQSQKAEGDEQKFVGNVETDEMAPSTSIDISAKPYDFRTLKQPSIVKNDIDIVYTYSGRTLQSQEQDGTKPIPVLTTKMIVDALYGAYWSLTAVQQNDYGNTYRFLYGGGTKSGADSQADIGYQGSAAYQVGGRYTQVVDFSSEGKNVYLYAPEPDVITRKIRITAKGNNIAVTGIRLEGVPEGVVIESTNSYSAKAIGKGIYFIEPQVQLAYVELKISYKAGMPDVMSKVFVNLEAFNFKYNTKVLANDVMVWDFKPVNSLGDILNETAVNTYTFSTKYDQLKIITSNGDDFVWGTKANNTYELLAGNDKFISGEGNDTVDMGDGNDTYYFGLGNNNIDGGSGDNIAYLANEFTKIEVNSTNFRISGGVISVSYAGYNTTLKNFSILVLDDQSNTINVSDTINTNMYVVANGASNNVINLNTIIVEAAAEIHVGSSYLTTNGGAGKLYYDVDLNKEYLKTVDLIIGKSGKDNIIADWDKGINYKYDGVGGSNKADYSRLDDTIARDFVFNADGDGKVVKAGSTTIDQFDGISTIIGTAGSTTIDQFDGISTIIGTANGKNTFYAAHGVTANRNMTYQGWVNTAQGSKTVDYKNASNGIRVDFTASTDPNTIKIQRGSSNQYQDTLVYIDNIGATEHADYFLMDDKNLSRKIDTGGNKDSGPGRGQDTVDYTKVTNKNLVFNIKSPYMYGGVAYNIDVDRGANQDKLTGVEKIIGGNGGSDNTFQFSSNSLINPAVTGRYGLEIVGGGSANSILDYSNLSDVSHNIVFIISGSSVTGTSKIIDSSNAQEIGEDKFSKINVFRLSQQDNSFTISNVSNLSRINSIEGNSNINIVNRFIVTGKVEQTSGLMSQLSTKISNFKILELNSTLGNWVTIPNNLDKIPVSFIYSSPSSAGNTLDVSSFSRVNFTITTGVVDHMPTSSSKYKYSGILGVVETFFPHISVMNFTTYIGTSNNDVFNVKIVNVADANINFTFVGGGGTDTLDYTGTNAGVSLRFDLVNKKVYKNYVVGGTNNRVDTFDSVRTVKGGSGDDFFIMNPDIIYDIDGGDGENTISFVNYVKPVDNIPLNQYKRIQRFELSNNNDSISIEYDDPNAYKINGNGGLDTYKVINSTAAVTFNIGVPNVSTGVVENNTKVIRGGVTDIISNFEKIIATGAGDKINVSSATNEDGIANGTSKTLYFTGGSTTELNYTASITTGLTLRIGGDGIGGKKAMYVVKQNSARDYIVEDKIPVINLNNSGAGNKNTVELDPEYVGVIDSSNVSNKVSKVTVNMGTNVNNTLKIIGNSTFSDNTLVINDLSATQQTLQISGTTYKISGWSVLEGGSAKNTFIFGSTNIYRNYTLKNTSSSQNFGEIYVSNINQGVTTLDLGLKQISFTGTTNKITFEYVDRFVFNINNQVNIFGSSQNANKFEAHSTTINNGMINTALNSIITYDAVTPAPANGYIFSIDTNKATINKSIALGLVDTVYGNFINKFVGTKSADTFNIYSPFLYSGGGVLELDGNGSDVKNILNLDVGASSAVFAAGVTVNFNTGYVQGINDLIKFTNFGIINGTRTSDTYLIYGAVDTLPNTLFKGGRIDGKGSGYNSTAPVNEGNVLDFRGVVGNVGITVGGIAKGVTLNMENSRLSISDTTDYFMTIANIDTIYMPTTMSGVNNKVLYSTSVASFKKIDGGGNGQISYENQTIPQIVKLDKIGGGVSGSSVQLVGFTDYTLTKYDDTILATAGSFGTATTQQSYKVNGGDGSFTRNKADYSGTSNLLTLAEALNANSSTDFDFDWTVSPGRVIDKISVYKFINATSVGVDELNNFYYIETAPNNTNVNMRVTQKSYEIKATANKQNKIDYNNLGYSDTSGNTELSVIGTSGSYKGDTMVVSFISGTQNKAVVYKKNGAGEDKGTDVLYNFNRIKGTRGSDTYSLSENYDRTNITYIDLSASQENSTTGGTQRGSIINANMGASAATSDFLYEEIAGNANLKIGAKTYNITNTGAVSFVQGSSNSINTTFKMNGTTQTSINAGIFSTNIIVDYTSATDKLTFDFSGGQSQFIVTSAVGKNVISADVSRTTIKSAGNQDEYTNLQDSITYKIENSAAISEASISYAKSISYVTFEVTAAGAVTVTKAGGVQDNLSGIKKYTGTSYNDVLKINLAATNIGNFVFNGGGGSNKLELIGATGDTILKYQGENSTVKVGAAPATNLRISNFNNFTIGDSSVFRNDKFILVDTRDDTSKYGQLYISALGQWNGSSGKNAFEMATAVPSDNITEQSNLTYDWQTQNSRLVVGSGNTFRYNASLKGFNEYDVSKLTNMTLQINNMVFSDPKLSNFKMVSKATQVRFDSYSYTGSAVVDLPIDITGKNLKVNGTVINNIFVDETGAGVKNYLFNNGVKININIDHTGNDLVNPTYYNLNLSNTANISIKLADPTNPSISLSGTLLDTGHKITSNYFRQSTLSVENATGANQTVNISGSSNIFQTITSTSAYNIILNMSSYAKNTGDFVLSLSGSKAQLQTTVNAETISLVGFLEYKLPSIGARVIINDTNGAYANITVFGSNKATDEIVINHKSTGGTSYTSSSFYYDGGTGGFVTGATYNNASSITVGSSQYGKYKNFTTLDLTNTVTYNAQGAPTNANNGSYIKLAPTATPANLFTTIFAPKPKGVVAYNSNMISGSTATPVDGANNIHNVLDLRGTHTSPSANLGVSFVDPNGTLNRYFTMSGSTSLTGTSSVYYSNFKHYYGNGNDNLVFSAIGLQQYYQLLYTISPSASTRNPGFNNILAFTTESATGSNLDLSQWNLYRKIIIGDRGSTSNANGVGTNGPSMGTMIVDAARVDGKDYWILGGIGTAGIGLTLGSQRTLMYVDVKYNLTLPKGIIYIESTVNSSSYTITASSNKDPYSYVMYAGAAAADRDYTASGNGGNGIRYYSVEKILFDDKNTGHSIFTNVSNPTGIKHEFNGVEVFGFGGKFDYLTIGAASGLFQSNKVRIYANGFINVGFGQQGDVADFSKVLDGNYYFGMDTWNNPRNNYAGIGDVEFQIGGNSRSITNTYYAKYGAYTGAGSGDNSSLGGVVVSKTADMNATEKADRSSLDLFYGIASITWLIGTGSDSTFSLGKFYYSSGNTYKWVSPYLASYTSSGTNQLWGSATGVGSKNHYHIDGGRVSSNFNNYNNTYIDQGVTADLMATATRRVDIIVKWEMGVANLPVPPGKDGTYGTTPGNLPTGATPITVTGNSAAAIGVASGTQIAAMQQQYLRVRTDEDWTGGLTTGVINQTRGGNWNNGNPNGWSWNTFDWGVNGLDYNVTSSNGESYKVAYERLSMRNMNNLKVQDYAEDLSTVGKAAGLGKTWVYAKEGTAGVGVGIILLGKTDKVTHFSDPLTGTTSVDLGGRYVMEGATFGITNSAYDAYYSPGQSPYGWFNGASTTAATGATLNKNNIDNLRVQMVDYVWDSARTMPTSYGSLAGYKFNSVVGLTIKWVSEYSYIPGTNINGIDSNVAVYATYSKLGSPDVTVVNNFKNFDVFGMRENGGVGTPANVDFRTNMNFDTLNGKIFSFGGAQVKYNYYFNDVAYNYNVKIYYRNTSNFVTDVTTQAQGAGYTAPTNVANNGVWAIISSKTDPNVFFKVVLNKHDLTNNSERTYVKIENTTTGTRDIDIKYFDLGVSEKDMQSILEGFDGIDATTGQVIDINQAGSSLSTKALWLNFWEVEEVIDVAAAQKEETINVVQEDASAEDFLFAGYNQEDLVNPLTELDNSDDKEIIVIAVKEEEEEEVVEEEVEEVSPLDLGVDESDFALELPSINENINVNLEESLSLVDLDLSGGQEPMLDISNISQDVKIVDTAFEDFGIITEGSIIESAKVEETSSMSYALEENMSVADDSGHAVVVEPNKNKNNNTGF